MPPCVEEDQENNSAAANHSLRRGKTIEQIYQKKTPLEHILLRPDTYVGSTEHQFEEMFIFDDKTSEIVHRKIDYVPALYKIFDEILVNAADNCMRDPKGMDLIDVTIDKVAGSISVMNNGKGIPVAIHKEHNMYVPSMIFGELLTSDNYNDNEKKITGGRNGYGAKLTNAFSKKFIVETSDHTVKKKLTQVFENNLSVKNKPKISDYAGKDFTRVTFWPDYARFGMKGLDDDMSGLMMKRVYDIAGSTHKKIKVMLNGKQVPVSCFEGYCKLYHCSEDKSDSGFCMYERVSDRWEIGVGVTDGSFQQVSFVNSINTIKGGTHVQHVTDQLVDELLSVLKSKNRGGICIKPQHVKNYLFIFVNCLIENPAFDSQTKETLTTKQSKFGSSCEISDSMLKKLKKCGIVEMILDWVRAKEKVDLGKQMRAGTKNQTRVLGIPKLDDANDAGGRNSQDCTLILTEGDSAKTLAVAGLSIVGRDKYGVFPLKGKLLNVRDANFKQVTGNAEIQNILKIMGLDTREKYETTKGLRYGSLMIMTDQDLDGSHIKGLLINLVQYWWPALMQKNGFLKEFVTPIVKVWKQGSKDQDKKDVKSFFTLNEYTKWQNRTSGGKGWKTKYYKGLGTSTAKEAKEYFRDIENHEIGFLWRDGEDDQAIDLAFNKKRADDRKDWINGYVEGEHVDHSQSKITYYDFVHKELVQFAKYDTARSVPSMVDGLKPSQRKVLFAAFKKKLKNDIKVAQFVGYISEQAAYHHGETSLENTVVNLAQNYVGSNNVNLLFPSGQFGTRLQGGKDHAASRYIYTHLCPTTRLLFHPDDDLVLKYLDDDGQKIEPFWYCPILPAVLMNGADGIGTGWSTQVPNFNPRDIIRNIQRLLRGEDMEHMCPWYKGFKGCIQENKTEPGKFEITGCIEKISDTILSITELPIRKWTQDYKEFLEELLPQDAKKSDDASTAVISDFKQFHHEKTVHFEITLTPEQMVQAEQQGLEKVFKLRTSISTSNMVLFDAEGKIAKYNTALDILKDFCKLRRSMYEKRKAHLVAKVTREKEILSNKARFILMVVEGQLELRKRKKADLLKDLQKRGFKPMSELDAIVGDVPEISGKSEDAAEDGSDQRGKDDPAEKTDYDYLLNMNLWNLTYEKIEELKNQRDVKDKELAELKRTSIEQFWDRDLQLFSCGLDEIDEMDAKDAEAEINAGKERKQKKGGKVEKPQIKTKAVGGRKRSVDETIDRSLMSRPLVAGAAVSEGGEKQTWGTAQPAQRKAAELQPAARGEEVDEAPDNPKPRRARVRRELEPAAVAEVAEPSAPAKEESGASLLSRLLLKKGDDKPMSSIATSTSSFSFLGSSDLFSYLDKPEEQESDQPYNALDVGLPPCLDEPDLGQDDSTVAKAKGNGRGRGRGRGRGKATSDDDLDVGQKVKRRKINSTT